MAIIIGADTAGSKLKDVVKDFLVGENFEVVDVRSDERRVGKECRSRWSPYH